MKSHEDRITEFLYILMRDQVPCGTVRQILRDMEKSIAQDMMYTNTYLAKMSEEYAKNLLNNEPIKYIEALEYE